VGDLVCTGTLTITVSCESPPSRKVHVLISIGCALLVHEGFHGPGAAVLDEQD
jgi:hypothetical protein